MGIFSEEIRLLVKADTKGVVQPLSKMSGEAKKAETAFDRMAKSVGVSSKTLKTGLVAGATAFIGANLVQYLNDSVTAYTNSAKAASDLAATTGGTVDEISRMTAALQDAGVSAEQAAGLLTKFTTSVGGEKGAAALDALNVSLVRTANGAVDYAATMVSAVDAIGQIGDSAQRNAALVNLFGKQGAAVFRDLYASGVKLSDAMAAIDKYRIFDANDVKSALAYDDAMDSLHASAQGLQFALGRGLAPALTTVANVATPLVNAFASLDTGTVALVASSAALYRYWGPLVTTTGALKSAMSSLGNAVLKPLTVDFTGLGTSAEAAEKKMKGVGALSKQTLAVGALAALAVGWELVSIGADNYKSKIDQVATSTTKLGEITAERARQMYDEMSFLGKWVSDWDIDKGAALGLPFFSITDEERADAYKKKVDEARQAARDLAMEQGGLAKVNYEAQDAMKALSDALAEGEQGQAGFADKVGAAARAQHDQNLVTQQGKDLMDAYAAASWDAVNATLAQIDKNYAQNRAVREYHKQVEETNKILRDGKATQEDKNQSLDDLGISALNAANALVELKSQEALLAGTTLSVKEKNDILIASLKERKREASTKAERDEIDALIRKLQSAQTTAGETYIEIGGIKFKEGTTEDQVYALKKRIADAASTGNVGLTTSLQAELDALKAPDIPMKVTLVGSDGKTPLAGEQSVTITTTTPGAEEAAATLNGLVNPATPYEAKINTKVYGWFAAEALLNSLAKDRYATVWVTTKQVGGGATDTTNPTGRVSQMGGLLTTMSSPTGRVTGANGQSYRVKGGTLEPTKPDSATQVIVNLDGRQIAQYLEPVVGRKRSA